MSENIHDIRKEANNRSKLRKLRTPITQENADKLYAYQKSRNYTDKQMEAIGLEVAEMGGTKFAGKIFTYLDAKAVREDKHKDERAKEAKENKKETKKITRKHLSDERE